ncbi:MAG: hypothetical protein HUU41_02510 [Bryobacteraceae bacterium]|nr:hypothetical protein [Bryobacterales bacterium]MEB2363750.1 hypothetical protein [Bryobacterales bacterium]NUM99962.1 hypothetical protein [Bryobacteraceae bacterium]
MSAVTSELRCLEALCDAELREERVVPPKRLVADRKAPEEEVPLEPVKPDPPDACPAEPGCAVPVPVEETVGVVDEDPLPVEPAVEAT